MLEAVDLRINERVARIEARFNDEIARAEAQYQKEIAQIEAERPRCMKAGCGAPSTVEGHAAGVSMRLCDRHVLAIDGDAKVQEAIGEAAVEAAGVRGWRRCRSGASPRGWPPGPTGSPADGAPARLEEDRAGARLLGQQRLHGAGQVVPS
jgi:hypothetical protein